MHNIFRKPIHRLLCALFIYLSLGEVIAQSTISGYVQNEKNEPIPYVNIYLKNSSVGTTTDLQGRYFLKLQPGEYELVYSSIGFELYELTVIVDDKPLIKNVWLKSSSTELDEIIVKASKKDPAYEIIKKVIDNRNEAQVKSAKTDVYVKAIEVLDKKEKEIKTSSIQEVVSLEGEPMDAFQKEQVKKNSKLSTTNLVEINLVLKYEFPNKYKEERTGYKAYGNTAGLFLPRFSETDVNLYENLIYLNGISQTPVISPLSRTSILSYRYKLEEVLDENALKIYKISVIPRKRGNSTVEGTLYINDSLWNINRFEIHFEKGALKFHDALSLSQHYKSQKEDSLWIPFRQAFSYKTKAGKRKTFRGTTVIHYNNYQSGYKFPPKFFGNEVAVTTQAAYDRDSSYWKSIRPEPLTVEEQEVVHYRDSIYTFTNSKVYKDSIEARYNRITIGDILYDGIGFRKHEKQQRIYFSSLLSLIDFSVIGGFRIGPYASYFKRFDNGKLLWTSGGMNLGFKNLDLQGRGNIFLRYLPFQLGDIQLRGGRNFESINNFDAYLNQLKISNYILHDYAGVSHKIELINGFYLTADANYSKRKSLQNYDAESLLNKVIDKENPIKFEDYEAFITNTAISYTPEQKYMREPNYKRVLGSNYPTFVLHYKKGWKNILSSDINFDYGEFQIKQNLLLGIFGNSNYTVKVGKFFNTRGLKYVDLRRFRQSDPYLYSDPLNSFQLLDTSLVANDWFLDAHYIHHFNGALINNIPLIKKLRINIVAGAGLLWIKESNYRYEELFAGFERIFKFGARRRLRIGAYGVLAESNQSPVRTGWKVSFDIIDTWKREWSY